MLYAGGGANELMTDTRKWNTGIAARGSIYVATDNKVYAFRIPSGGTPTPTPTELRRPPNTDCYSDCYSNCDANRNSDCDSDCNFDGHAYCDSNANIESQLPRPLLQAVRRRHPDQPPLRDPMRHRGRARLRCQDRSATQRIIGERTRLACWFRRRAETNFP